MKALKMILPVLATFALLLTGCEEHASTPTPAVERPLLERGVTHVQHGRDGVLLIPADAYSELAGTPGVFILSQNKLARFRMVKAGKRHGDQLEIISGLSGDETLVLGPYTNMLDGSPIRIRSD